MPQRPLNQGPQPAKLASSNEAMRDVLPPNTTIERRKDGSVWRVEKYPEQKNGPDYSEVRIDSPKDHDAVLKGEDVWYLKHLKKAAQA